MSIIHQLERKQVGLRILNLGMDTKTTTGKLMLTILGVTTRNRKRTNPQSAHRQTQIK
jgi:DNA invertase Pin-like site-specific DNA recombinase